MTKIYKSQLPVERLKETVKYDRETGFFHWVEARRGLLIGDRAGCTSPEGYVVIRIDGTLYQAHRLAWLYVTEEDPKTGIDHINGNPSDNSFVNLRLASQEHNVLNARKRTDNTSGIKGVCWCPRKNKWRGYVSVRGRQVLSKYFDRKDAATIAVRAVREHLHGEFTNHG